MDSALDKIVRWSASFGGICVIMIQLVCFASFCYVSLLEAIPAIFKDSIVLNTTATAFQVFFVVGYLRSLYLTCATKTSLEMFYKEIEGVFNEGDNDKYQRCGRCREYRPDRTYHCSLCCKCVVGLQYHSFLVNNCIGRYNFKYYMSYLTFVILNAGGVCVMGLYYVMCLYHGLDHIDVTPWLMAIGLLISMTVLTGVSFIYLLHLLLINEDITWHEMKYARDPGFTDLSAMIKGRYSFVTFYPNLKKVMQRSSVVLELLWPSEYEWQRQSHGKFE
mmetsp:Transcript_36608/g.41693  ORF Transcript_36608/g.41693 Transcript_36608/m.41693 type:complete len:276 (+) Transcript_36608:32-859(+)